tara:strand:- start:436 stop:696 length:261 start_codon:yes stop_codon:yes gene_type:complete
MKKDPFDDLPLTDFKLPEEFLAKIFELSGSTEGNRGFVLTFVNQRGEPTVYTKADSQIIEMGLRKSLEKYLIDSEEADHFSGQDPV